MAAWPYNTAAWQRLRRLKLDEEPMSQPCLQMGRLTPANTVDHNVPISKGGDAFPGTAMLTSMCRSCHSAKTARGVEAGAVRSTKPRKGCDYDGNPLDPQHAWHEQSLTAGKSIPTVPLNSQLVSRLRRG